MKHHGIPNHVRDAQNRQKKQAVNGALAGYPGPDPRKVAVLLPVGDFRIDIECIMGVMRCMPFFARPIVFGGCSLVNEARNQLAHGFLNSFEKFDWAVWIDSDIAFTPEDWCALMDDSKSPFVVGAYPKKNEELTRVTTGFGFVKVHRKVFEAIADLKTDEGAERVPRFYRHGQLMIDYFPTGASGDANWLGEDDGFIAWARLAGYPPRPEPRVKLVHYGRHGYRLPTTT